MPWAPCSPCVPGSPRGPAGSWPALKSPARREWFFTFEELTALRLIWVGPTLFRGSFRAAYAPPPSATNTATVAMTLAYVRPDLILRILKPHRLRNDECRGPGGRVRPQTSLA